MSRARVLLTTAGRKSYLARILRASNRAEWVVAVDLDPETPIRALVDAFGVVPPVSDEADFVEAVAALCREHEIDCILPQNDRELGALARARGELEKGGTRVAGLDAAQVEIVGDKLAFAKWLDGTGIAYPPTFVDVREFSAACGTSRSAVEKRRYGQGSDGLVIHSRAPNGPLDPGQILQPRIEGDEYNLDVLRDSRGDVVTVSVKRKLLMEDGSTARAISSDRPDLAEVGGRLADRLGAFGSIDIDLIDAVTGPVVLDVNPRMGGGFPFTAEFCPAYVDCLLDVCTGRSIGARDLAYPIGHVVCREYRFSSVPDARHRDRSHPESTRTAPGGRSPWSS